MTAAGMAALYGRTGLLTMGTRFDVFCRRTVVVSLLAAWILALVGCSGSSSSSSSSSQTPTGNPVGANLTQVSSDPYTVAPGQHATEVEPHMLANGTTLVAAFQIGRISPVGANAIGEVTSSVEFRPWRFG